MCVEVICELVYCGEVKGGFVRSSKGDDSLRIKLKKILLSHHFELLCVCVGVGCGGREEGLQEGPLESSLLTGGMEVVESF